MKISAVALAIIGAAFCACPALASPTDDAMAAFDLKDYSKASDLFKQTASSGDAISELMLGYLYEHGQGMTQDQIQARQWYTLALTKTDEIARKSPSARDAAFLRSVVTKARAFIAAAQQDEAAAVSSVYTGDQYRDPFTPLDMSASKRGKKFTRSDFNIHHLQLRGIMDDGRSGYALFVDPDFDVSFVLKQGRLYDDKGKIMSGVWGVINMRGKSAELTTSDQDVQPFHLGGQ